MIPGFKNNFKTFLIYLLVTPGLIWMLVNIRSFAEEWQKIPAYFNNNVHSFFSEDKLRDVYDARWNAFSPDREDLLSKVYYNKGFVVISQVYSLSTYFNPRIYFQAGDNTNLTPQIVEPIAFIGFFFWILGIVYLLKKKYFKIFGIIFALGIFAFLFGQRTMAFLFPIMILYSYISYVGAVNHLNKKNMNIYLYIYLIYSLYLIGRMLII